MSAEAVVSVAVETLGNLLLQEARFLRGVKDQVERLRTEFRRIQSLLKDADRKQHDSETIRNWIKEIRLLAYRAEDVLEEYIVKVGPGSGDRGSINVLKRFVCFANELRTSHNLIGSEIEKIMSKINSLTGQMNLSGIQHLITEETSNKGSFIKKTCPHQELQRFVGMDEDIGKLVSLLVNDEESRHRVIGVWGTGGSGKTTVAEKVYKNVYVRIFFDSFAWVRITRKCQIQSVMQDILRQLLPEEINIDIEDTNELEEKIYSVQMEKKCLIVLDDIWKFHDWRCLSKCFPNFVSQSKVLLMTRSANVADIGYPIQLKGFTEDEAWKLLCKKAFANIDLEEQLDDSKYQILGRMMIHKCDCLPLAVAVLGGILSGKNSLNEWKLASDDVNSYIGRGEGTGEPGELGKVLALSYDELPYQLKTCFLSLGFLQEDEHTSVERIYDMWMAEGLIRLEHVSSSQTMRDAAKCYLYELQFRSMVLLHDHSTSLSLHDSILDFCRSKAKEEEFLMVVDKSIVSEKAYRLVSHVDDENDYLDVLRSAENITPLRSVQIRRKSFSNFIILPTKIFNLPQFKSLRILIFVSHGFREKCFHGIESLIHLRLLGLIGCECDIFSLESVDKLYFLQTLDLTGTTVSLMKSPSVDTFRKMRQLRHLYLPLFPGEFIRIEGKLRLINLSEVETLYHLQSNFYELEDLVHLQKLRSLRCCTINDDESLRQITDYMCGSNLTWIDITIRYCYRFLSDSLRKLLSIPNVTLELCIESCMLLKLPPLETIHYSKMCPGLVKLSFGRTDIAEDIMQALDKFPNIKTLRLICIRFSGKEMICDAGSFPRLEELSLFSVEGKFELKIDEAAMPNLSSMEIAGCSGINFMIPERLRLLILKT